MSWFCVCRGSADATRQAHTLIMALIKDPDKDLEQLLPKNKQKPVGSASTSNNTFSSSMWHNSMANNIGIPASTNTGTIFTSTPATMVLQRNQSSRGGMINSGRNNTGTGTTSSGQQVAGLFANAVKQSQVGSGPRPPNVAQGGSQSLVQASPKRSGGKQNATSNPPLSAAGMAGSKSPSMVARQLFPQDSNKTCSSQPSVTTAKTTITYCTSSVSKTKVVTSSAPSFVGRMDNDSSPIMSSRVQHINPLCGTNSKHQSGPGGGVGMSGKLDPQPLPIMTGPNRNNVPVQGSGQGPSMQGPGSAGDFSPFNNLFSQVADRVLGKKDEMDGKMNFASVAAAGVVIPNQTPPPPSDQKPLDPSLPAKAPGYKAPGQRTSSPLMKAPGYIRNPVQGQPQPGMSLPLTSQGIPFGFGPDQIDPSQVDPAYFAALMAAHSGADLPLDLMDPLRMSGYKVGPGPMAQMDANMRVPGYNKLPMSHSGMSPRSMASMPNFGGNLSPGGLFDFGQPQHRDEYSTPNRPMTLPKIESTLNPNAPDFTSRTGGGPELMSRASLLHQHQQLMSMSSNLAQQNFASGGPPLGSNAGGQGIRVPPPAGTIGQQAFNTAVLQANTSLMLVAGSSNAGEFPTGAAGLGNFVATAALLGSGNVPPSVQRQMNMSGPPPIPPPGTSSSQGKKTGTIMLQAVMPSYF